MNFRILLANRAYRSMKIIGISSGKGGVGKSTVAANLAVALASKGLSIGLIDADFYGPSIPILLGMGELQLNHEQRIIPCNRFGVKYVSIQFFLQNPDDPVIWRGPMITKALMQMLNDCVWDDVQLLIIDMPPGTGDIQLSLSQLASLAGVVLVTTPQKLSVSDVAKAGRMFRKVNVPILGIIENMTDTPEINLFGSDGSTSLARDLDTEILGAIPINREIAKNSDQGTPVCLTEHGKIFFTIAEKILKTLEKAQTTEVEVSQG
ncbi:MAG: Mrp/NBP35 family ATP-binding protein [Deltaproteobacteria bacterium]|nr:Mrp/NBP35 family ATP-binding protein [Deltaproteobacteria bacterium]MCX7952104.1 Mrp/NBP35 family ATP-binding protein [Deltaproteobacteria bacterium]